jgi:hypothetical protein
MQPLVLFYLHTWKELMDFRYGQFMQSSIAASVQIIPEDVATVP